jgi:hypothetical protein
MPYPVACSTVKQAALDGHVVRDAVAGWLVSGTWMWPLYFIYRPGS